METIQPVVVIYNTECSESSSVMGLLQQGLKPLIIDNSTSEYGNEHFCLIHDIPYCSMGENAGLSRAYNKALSLINDNVDYLLWMDDDTMLPEGYVESILISVREYKEYDVLIPIVKSGNTVREILSPCVVRNSHTYRVATIDELDEHEISAINSGLLVKRSVYKDFRYDEGLFLDCIDHDFIAWCHAQNLKMCILKNVVINQSFSSDEKTSTKDRISRYKIFAKDYKYYRKKNNLSAIQTQLYLLKRLLSILLR
ncbi:MAG: glycosyltransferase [Eubacteriaceae bacterium]|nr:glycosyltransferase [Eubacteriaceae bacterium]